MKNVLSLITLALAAAPAMAQSISGDTTGMPLWNRPVANGNLPPTGLSGTGTATPYEVVPFTVSANGVYVWQNIATGLWDNYTFIYQNGFNAGSPLTNGLIGNDDNPGIGASGFTLALNAGTQYYYVVTGFGNTNFGAWTVDVTVAPGTAGGVVNFAPTPGAVALLGLGGLAAARRRR